MGTPRLDSYTAQALIDELRSPESWKRTGKRFLDTLNRGVVGGTLGGLADTGALPINAGIWGYNKLTGSDVKPIEPTGGSEWFGKQMEDAGIVSPERNTAAETMAGGLLAPLGGVALQQRAPQIAEALLRGGENLAAPRSTSPAAMQRGAVTAGFEEAPTPAKAKTAKKAAGKAIDKAGDLRADITAAVEGQPAAIPAPGTKEGKALYKEIVAGRVKAGPEHAELLGFDPVKLRTEYPTVVEPVLTVDPKTGKEFYPRNKTPEMESLEKFRAAVQKDIGKGNYQPKFDVSQRYYVDPSEHPLQGSTITDAIAKKPETIAKHQAKYDTPEVRQRLMEGYLRAENDPLAKDWYAMGQLQDSAIAHHGGDRAAGAEAFRTQFADPMAAWTGGSDPATNFQNAAYGNWLEGRNMPTPTSAYTPHPVGGRYLANNLKSFEKHRGGVPMSAADQPKRHNFSANFRGHRDRPTIDEQMMTAIDPTGKDQAPPTGTYGVIEPVINDLAAQKGVQPVNFQDVAWAGLKGTQGKPMMQQVNESLERTARVTGQTADEALKGYWNRQPMYGIAGGGIGTAALIEALRQQEQGPQ